MKHLLDTCGLSSLLLSAPLLAQGNASATPALGPLSALPTGLSYTDAPALSPDSLLVRGAGSSAGAPALWSVPPSSSVGNYTYGSMFDAVPDLDLLVQVDAHSSRNELIPSLGAGGNLLMPGGNRWFALGVVVSNDSLGNQNSWVARRRAGGLGTRTTAGADVLGYFFKRSNVIDPALLGKTLLEQSAESLHLSNDEDIDALDFGIGYSAFGGNAPTGAFFTSHTKYYFSVSRISAGLINTLLDAYPNEHWAFDDMSNPVDADPGAVYYTYWNGANWAPITEFRSAEDFGWDPNEYDIDALSLSSSGDPTIIFSVAKEPELGVAPLDSQLMAHQLGAHGQISMALREQSGGLVAAKMGVRGNRSDVTGTCGIDPEIVSGFGLFARQLGQPIGPMDYSFPLPLAKEPIGLGVATVDGLSGMPQDVVFEISGAIPAPGDQAQLWISLDYDAKAPSAASWSLLDDISLLAGSQTHTYRFPWGGLGFPLAVSVAAVYFDSTSGTIRVSRVTAIGM